MRPTVHPELANHGAVHPALANQIAPPAIIGTGRGARRLDCSAVGESPAGPAACKREREKGKGKAVRDLHEGQFHTERRKEKRIEFFHRKIIEA